jgi:hypothetical protein
MFRLCRVSFLNRRRIQRPGEALLGMRLLREAIRASRDVFQSERPVPAGPLAIDHLARYEASAGSGGDRDRAPAERG